MLRVSVEQRVDDYGIGGLDSLGGPARRLPGQTRTVVSVEAAFEVREQGEIEITPGDPGGMRSLAAFVERRVREEMPRALGVAPRPPERTYDDAHPNCRTDWEPIGGGVWAAEAEPALDRLDREVGEVQELSR